MYDLRKIAKATGGVLVLAGNTNQEDVAADRPDLELL